jgi:hypothetical protein
VIKLTTAEVFVVTSSVQVDQSREGLACEIEERSWLALEDSGIEDVVVGYSVAAVEAELLDVLDFLPVGRIPPGKMVMTEPLDVAITVADRRLEVSVVLTGRALEAKRVVEETSAKLSEATAPDSSTLPVELETESEITDELVRNEVGAGSVVLPLVSTMLDVIIVSEATIDEVWNPVSEPEGEGEPLATLTKELRDDVSMTVVSVTVETESRLLSDDVPKVLVEVVMLISVEVSMKISEVDKVEVETIMSETTSVEVADTEEVAPEIGGVFSLKVV